MKHPGCTIPCEHEAVHAMDLIGVGSLRTLRIFRGWDGMDGLPEERLERRRTTDTAPISQCAPMLESVGRIAGVVAHDFGNLLTALDSRLELIAAILSDRPEVRALAEESMRTSAQGA